MTHTAVESGDLYRLVRSRPQTVRRNQTVALAGAMPGASRSTSQRGAARPVRASLASKLLFLPSVHAPFPTCKGARYNSKTFEITIDGKPFSDVLAMTVDDALAFFIDDPAF